MNRENHIKYIKVRKADLEYRLKNMELSNHTKTSFKLQLKWINNTLKDYGE